MKAYDILEVKNALIKPMCCLSERTAFCLLCVLRGNISLFLAHCLTGTAQSVLSVHWQDNRFSVPCTGRMLSVCMSSGTDRNRILCREYCGAVVLNRKQLGRETNHSA
jgi:hypothetical protein